ncbi:MAG: hypothetical protein PHN57_06995 [Candidatus Omnitrophica bacterium]|nr:hypothetical protein [Candidatus Omnitrophota bacterium]
MKKLTAWIIVLIFMAAGLTEAQAGWFGKKKATPEEAAAPQASSAGQQPQKSAPAQKVDKAKAKADKEKQALEDRSRSQLNNTEWQIELTPLSGKGKKESETVMFKNNQITFANYAKKGFPMTNYTLTGQDDGSIVWETMQTSDKAGICFWRGEMDASLQSLRGILSHQINDKTKEDFSFVSVKKNTVPAGK